MKASKDLYQLINSLSKAEKIYFKRFSSNHVIGPVNSYIKLFKEFDKHTADFQYSEKAIKKKLAESGTIKNFEFIKNYLHKNILKSLSNFYYDVNTNNKIKNNIKYIEILYKKSLFGSCKKILEKSLKLAYSSDNYLAIIELLRWKKNLIYEGSYKEDQFVLLEQTYNEEKKIIDKLSNLTDFMMLSFRTRSLINGINPYFRGERIIKELQKILEHPLLLSENKALSLQASMYYYEIQALIYKNLDNNKNAFNSWEKIINLMENNPGILKGYFINFIIAIYNLLGPCLNLKMFDKLEYYLYKLKSLEKTNPDKIFENDRIMIFVSTSLYELRMHIIRGNFSMLASCIKDAERGLELYGRENVITEKLEIFYLIGYAYFACGKTGTALEWINKINNDKELIHDSILHVKSRIFSLILHYELGNYDALEHLIKSSVSFLKKNKFYGPGDLIIINFLKNSLQLYSKIQVLNLLNETLQRYKAHRRLKNNKLLDLVKRLEDQSNFMDSDEFDIESWLESKINNCSLKEIIITKHNRKN